MTNYQGLGSYSRERPDPLARREGESDQNWERRTAIHRRFADEVADEAAWAEHRARVDAPVGQGSGLYGRTTPTDRAAALGSRGFGSGREVEKEGGLAVTAVHGQVAIRRIYAADIRDQGEPGVSPLAQYLRSSAQQ